MKKVDVNNVVQYQPYLDKMPDSHLKSYIVTRVINQIDWYDGKSISKQKVYKLCSIISIILNGVVPVAMLLSDYGIIVKILIAALSAAAGIINTIVVLGNYKDLWIQYRMNCEALKRTLYRFFLQVGEFQGGDIDNPVLYTTLVTSCEELMAKEFQSWSSSTKKTMTSLDEKLNN